jgi:two-component system, cell cycle sensor histidine kinase and response regulator CckA
VHAFRTRSLILALVIGIIGALISWMVVHRVTERSDATELAERAALLEQKNELLRTSELRFRQLVDHSPEGVIVHRSTRIIFATPGAARLFGADDPDQIVGRSVLEFLHPDDRMGGVDVLGMSAKPGEPTPLVDIRLARPENAQAVVEATSMGVNFDGQPAVQTIMRDITEKQLLEEQFRQAQKMEAVGKLAGGIAHDFNNLLTIIHTYTELTLSATPESDPRHADLSEVMHATTSAARLTRQMLAFSRKQVLAPARIDLNEATGGVIAMIKRIIGDNIEVSTNLRDGVAPIWADVGQLEQVLLNLSVNARDAMPNGGLLTIETSNVRLESGYSSHHGQPIPAGEYVLLTVADTGSGMTEDVQRQIFDPFFTTKEPGKGTGLGLSTVYGIVKQSEGHIWVYSETGQGTVFKIYLPRYAGTEGDNAAPSLEPVPMLDRPTHVLLVEDEPHVRAAVRRVLESRKIRVTEADRPSTAAAMFSDGTDDIDLVLTDMMMPEKNGAELVRELTVRKPDLRAIIMSGYSEEATSRQWRLPPNALFIEKPIAPADLFRKLHDALGWVA